MNHVPKCCRIGVSGSIDNLAARVKNDSDVMQSVVSLLNRSLAVLDSLEEKKRSFLVVQVETLMRRITSSSTCFIHDPSS